MKVTVLTKNEIVRKIEEGFPRKRAGTNEIINCVMGKVIRALKDGRRVEQGSKT
jgi:nucleoid DNA-binding protein